MMNVNIVYNPKDKRRARQVGKAVQISNDLQRYFHFILNQDNHWDTGTELELSWEKFREDRMNSQILEDEYFIYITEKRLDDNWFSHEEAEFALISVYGWEDDFSPPSLEAYLIYQIAQSVINFAANLNEQMEINMAHGDVSGCLYDFCGYKKEIKIGMAAGSICPKCKATLVGHGVDQNALRAVEKMAEYVRSLAIGKPVSLSERKAFVVMKYTENDENDHAYKYGILPALEDLKIPCVRADQKINSGQILEKVRTEIKKSRFIIVKMDEENLNVYFELGLAMGEGKDVILICEKEWLHNLPSDLKNWECLTYQKGNYEGLRKKIKQCFRDNYQV